MSDGDCQRVNPEWHVACDVQLVAVGGQMMAVCRDCLVVCTIADTWYGQDKAKVARGRRQNAVVVHQAEARDMARLLRPPVEVKL